MSEKLAKSPNGLTWCPACGHLVAAVCTCWWCGKRLAEVK